MKLAVVNLKGGSGKTTSSIFLAAALAERGRTLLIDADPQGSTLSWSESAGEFPYPVIALPVKDLHKRLPALIEGYDHVVIDTPPGDIPIVRSALLAADVALVTLSPNLIEIDRMQPTLALMADVEQLNPDLTVSLLFTRVRRNTNSYRAAREFLAELGLPVLDTEIPLRERFSTAFGLEPKKPEQYENVLKELLGEELPPPEGEPTDLLEAPDEDDAAANTPEPPESPADEAPAPVEGDALTKILRGRELTSADELAYGPVLEEVREEVRSRWDGGEASDVREPYSTEYPAADAADPDATAAAQTAEGSCEDGHDWHVDRLDARWELDPPQFLHRCSRCDVAVYAHNVLDADGKAREERA